MLSILLRPYTHQLSGLISDVDDFVPLACVSSEESVGQSDVEYLGTILTWKEAASFLWRTFSPTVDINQWKSTHVKVAEPWFTDGSRCWNETK